MCLFTNQEKPKVCKTPIRCMKIVRRRLGGGYEPCFYRIFGDVYRLGEIVQLVTPNIFDDVHDFGEFVYSGENIKVQTGFHTYTYGNGNIVKVLEVMKNEGEGELVVLECEIPKGALYYEGHCNVHYHHNEKGLLSETGYCSDRLRVIREVPLSEVENICGSAI